MTRNAFHIMNWSAGDSYETMLSIRAPSQVTEKSFSVYTGIFPTGSVKTTRPCLPTPEELARQNIDALPPA